MGYVIFCFLFIVCCFLIRRSRYKYANEYVMVSQVLSIFIFFIISITTELLTGFLLRLKIIYFDDVLLFQINQYLFLLALLLFLSSKYGFFLWRDNVSGSSLKGIVGLFFFVISGFIFSLFIRTGKFEYDWFHILVLTGCNWLSFIGLVRFVAILGNKKLRY